MIRAYPVLLGFAESSTFLSLLTPIFMMYITPKKYVSIVAFKKRAGINSRQISGEMGVEMSNVG